VPLPGSSYGSWVGQRFSKEFLELSKVTRDNLEVVFGIVFVLASLPISILLLARMFRPVRAHDVNEFRVVYSLFTSFSAVLALAFILFVVDDSGDWHYRFLTMTTVFAVVLFSSVLVPLIAPLDQRWPGVLATLTVVGVLALTVALGARRETAQVAEYRAFLRDVNRLTQMIRKHTGQVALRGLAEYWTAMDISVRSDDLRVDTLAPERAVFRFYNNNAGSLCGGSYQFIIRRIRDDHPKRSAIVAGLGEPKATEETHLARHGQIEVMYYDPALLRERVTEDAIKAAIGIFPTFNCPRWVRMRQRISCSQSQGLNGPGCPVMR
jgi:hypothetical protein